MMNKRGVVEGSFWSLIVTFVMFAGFVWLILSVAIGFGDEYGRDSDEIGQGAYDVNDYYESIEDVEANSLTYRTRFEGGDVDDIDDPSGLFSVATSMIAVITAPFGLLGNIASNLGIPTIIISMMLGLLGILLILSIWRVLRSGS